MKRQHYSAAEIRLRELLTEKRRQKGLTQLELSRALDNSRGFASKYESGERFLTFTEVILICKHLGVDPADVVTDVARRVPEVAPLVPLPNKVGRPRKQAQSGE